jgi:hypothetical protein
MMTVWVPGLIPTRDLLHLMQLACKSFTVRDPWHHLGGKPFRELRFSGFGGNCRDNCLTDEPYHNEPELFVNTSGRMSFPRSSYAIPARRESQHRCQAGSGSSGLIRPIAVPKKMLR